MNKINKEENNTFVTWRRIYYFEKAYATDETMKI